VLRHSKSATAEVALSRHDGVIRLQISDQGQGIQDGQQGDMGRLGVGLLSVRERILQLRGRLQIISDKGKGTSIVATIPEMNVAESRTQGFQSDVSSF